MASLNKILIIGHLGNDPEVRTFPSGDQVANISVATSERWKDKQSGEQREETTWHRIQFFGRLAEIAGEYLRKGSQVYVEGSLRQRSYDKDGTTHYITEIRADRMQMLGDPKGDGGQRDGGGRGQGGGRDDRGGQQRGGGRDQGRGNGGNQRGGNDRGGYAPRGSDRGGDRGGYSEDRGQQRNDDQQDRGRGGGQERSQGGGQARGPAQQQGTARPAAGAPTTQGGGGSGFDDFDDDIPFIAEGFFMDPMVDDRKGKRLGRASF